VPSTDDGGGSPAADNPLEAVLAEARQLGFFGPGPLEPQLRHARGFVTVAQPLFTAPPHLVDMGAGGGLPGLVVAQEWPEVTLVLLEASERRSAFLRRAVDQLDLGGRVSVLQQRAEMTGRDPNSRATFDGAIARSFGRPAVLAECTAPLLKTGAWIVVSEPPASSSVPTAVAAVSRESDQLADPEASVPGTPDPGTAGREASEPVSPDAPAASGDAASERWPAAELEQLGLEPGLLVHADFYYQLLRQVGSCPERFPRRNGVPSKKPLF
jgi:16S rRNA (guanine527-N7)-methyltransferase